MKYEDIYTVPKISSPTTWQSTVISWFKAAPVSFKILKAILVVAFFNTVSNNLSSDFSYVMAQYLPADCYQIAINAINSTSHLWQNIASAVEHVTRNS